MSSSAFLWWGPIYSAPPARVQGEQERQKFRDEGLILVQPEATEGVHPFQERTPKSYVFQQFARFVRPGWVRLEVDSPQEPDAPLVCAFRSADCRQAAVVLIHPDKAAPKSIQVRITGAQSFHLDRAYITDRRRNCEAAEWSESLPPESVTTLLYAADSP